MKRIFNRTLLLLSAAQAPLFFSSYAPAQGLSDINPPLPNVLLIVDTSGSMERKSEGQGFPACDPTGVGTNERSRWVETIEVLTGSIQNYRCQALLRNSQAFRDEYSLDGKAPYDYNYINPYHRPLSNDCTPAPGILPTNAYEFPAGAIKYRPYTNLGGTCNNWSQSSDGILDTFGQFVRFGLMTFDTLPDAGTGVSGTGPLYPDGISGTWSYYLGQPAKGWPEDCLTEFNMEVGVRNAAAPPWEGRMVPFGDPNANAVQVAARNGRIQEILLASRPFGATPIAGAMSDARDFFWNDDSDDLDPEANGTKFGPSEDSQVVNGCRKQAIILLTDGEPNLDLRPACEGTGSLKAGQCPYPNSPEKTAELLFTPQSPSERSIKTYVVGFALDEVVVGSETKNCNEFSDDDLIGATGLCMDPANQGNVSLQACCVLNRIAFRGGTGRSYFARNQSSLSAALSAIMQDFSTVTTRTRPAFSTAATGSASPGFRFFSAFQPAQKANQLPAGILERQRYTCKDSNGNITSPQPLPIEVEEGDDFSANLNAQAADERWFLSFNADDVGGVRRSDLSIRPALTTDPDGLGSQTGEAYRGLAANFVASTEPGSMQLASTDVCQGLSDTACRDLVLKWLVGLDNGTQYHRCPVPGGPDCRLLGDILHSTPAVVNRPLAFLRDESYQAFAQEKAKRPLVLYVSTNDGFLHAFRVASNETDPNNDNAELDPVDARANNELWAFIPPAVLPHIKGQYPGVQRRLLNGSPVVKDVVAKKLENGSYRFERSQADAQAGVGEWRTVLVQSFGPGAAETGYFALDITDPVITNEANSGPKFLWQLTRAGDNTALFGPSAGKPLITTVFFDDDGVGGPEEVPVAVLPGGDGTPASGTCPRAGGQLGIDTNYAARTEVRCYDGVNNPGRSLTIVRLDNGKIIRTFRGNGADTPVNIVSVVGTLAKIDAPIVGEPVAFPATPGAVVDRVFVGDKEGGLWKVDLSSTNPSNWTMKLFFDAFPSSLGHTEASGQPIATPPILSVDDVGNLTIAFSTGDQEVFTYSAGTKNYVWSLSEKLNDLGTFESRVNWYQVLNDGERVTGPITLFNRNLYFSSFLPDSGSGGCSLGSAWVWGVDYLIKDPLNSDGSGGKDALVVAQGPPIQIADKLNVSTQLQDNRTSIFGVGVAQEPTCFDEEEVSSDALLGLGTRKTVSSIHPGKFQLVVQTGAGDSSDKPGRTNTLAIDLPSPALTSVIDSWAAIVE